jgi:hypothetical protein
MGFSLGSISGTTPTYSPIFGWSDTQTSSTGAVPSFTHSGAYIPVANSYTGMTAAQQQAALAKLTPKERQNQIFNLLYYGEYTNPQGAAILGQYQTLYPDTFKTGLAQAQAAPTSNSYFGSGTGMFGQGTFLGGIGNSTVPFSGGASLNNLGNATTTGNISANGANAIYALDPTLQTLRPLGIGSTQDYGNFANTANTVGQMYVGNAAGGAVSGAAGGGVTGAAAGGATNAAVMTPYGSSVGNNAAHGLVGGAVGAGTSGLTNSTVANSAIAGGLLTPSGGSVGQNALFAGGNALIHSGGSNQNSNSAPTGTTSSGANNMTTPYDPNYTYDPNASWNPYDPNTSSGYSPAPVDPNGTPFTYDTGNNWGTGGYTATPTYSQIPDTSGWKASDITDWLAAHPQVTSAMLQAGGSYLNNQSAQQSAQTQANAQLQAAQIAANAAKFKPVGVTTNFGSSNFGYDANGNLTSAGYTLNPQIQANQNQIMSAINGTPYNPAQSSSTQQNTQRGMLSKGNASNWPIITSPDVNQIQLKGSMQNPAASIVNNQGGQSQGDFSPYFASNTYAKETTPTYFPSNTYAKEITPTGYSQYPSGGLLGQATGAQSATAPMGQAANTMFDLGNNYLSTTPEQQAAKYYADQQALLSTSRDRGLSDLQTQMQNRGRTGLATGATGMMGEANPELEAFYNAQRQQDLGLAANATQGGMDYAKFGAGMVGQGGSMLQSMYDTQAAAWKPYTTAMGAATSLEGLGQNAMDLGTSIGQKVTTAGSNAGTYLANGMTNAAATMAPVNANNNWGNLLTGAGSAVSSMNTPSSTGSNNIPIGATWNGQTWTGSTWK